MKRSREAGDDGVTMVEAAIVILLLGVVSALVFASFSSMLGAYQGVSLRTENTSEAMVLMDTLTKDMRTANFPQPGVAPFALGKADEAIFYADLGHPENGPKLVHIYLLSDGTLVEATTDPDPGSSPPTYNGFSKNRYVSHYIRNSGTANPMITYFDDNGQQLVTPLSSADLMKVVRVNLNLVVSKTGVTTGPDTTLIDSVTMPNLT